MKKNKKQLKRLLTKTTPPKIVFSKTPPVTSSSSSTKENPTTPPARRCSVQTISLHLEQPYTTHAHQRKHQQPRLSPKLAEEISSTCSSDQRVLDATNKTNQLHPAHHRRWTLTAKPPFPAKLHVTNGLPWNPVNRVRTQWHT